MNTEICPVCGMDLFNCIRKEDGARCTDWFGIYDRYKDRTIAYVCPACGAKFDRYTEKQIFPEGWEGSEDQKWIMDHYKNREMPYDDK